MRENPEKITGKHQEDGQQYGIANEETNSSLPVVQPVGKMLFLSDKPVPNPLTNGVSWVARYGLIRLMLAGKYAIHYLLYCREI